MNLSASICPVWCIMVDKKEIGTLSNGRAEPQSEFWAVYDMHLTDSSYDKLVTDPDYWISSSVYLKNQIDPSIKIKSFITSLREEGKIAIRILID